MCVGALSTCMSVHPMLVAPEKNLELESQTVERHVGAEPRPSGRAANIINH